MQHNTKAIASTTPLLKQFRTLIFAPDQKLGTHFEQVCADVRYLRILRNVPRYPTNEEFVRLLRIYVPHIIFIQVADIEKICAFARIAGQEAPGVRVVAINGTCEQDMIITLMRKGFQELLYAPFTKEHIWDLLVRVNEHFETHPAYLVGTDLVYAFLPAKPGVGATTLAVNTAAALSKSAMRTFLADFDLNCGLIRFVLQLKNTHSVLDAVEKAECIDDTVWPQLVTSFGSLDVIHAGGLSPGTRLEVVQLRTLLEYLRRAYKIVCADLSGNMEKYSLELMHEAKQIFVVTTPELPALHLAREKIQFLTDMDLGDRISVLLNRVSKDSVLSVAEIESLVGRPVTMSFPNDYRAVHHAVAAGTFMNSNSALAKKCALLAKSMADGKKVDSIPMRRSFVEYFSLVPALYKVQRT